MFGSDWFMSRGYRQSLSLSILTYSVGSYSFMCVFSLCISKSILSCCVVWKR